MGPSVSNAQSHLVGWRYQRKETQRGFWRIGDSRAATEECAAPVVIHVGERIPVYHLINRPWRTQDIKPELASDDNPEPSDQITLQYCIRRGYEDKLLGTFPSYSNQPYAPVIFVATEVPDLTARTRTCPRSPDPTASPNTRPVPPIPSAQRSTRSF